MASGASVIFPPFCLPKCNHRLSATDLFPVISGFIEGQMPIIARPPISCQYPLVEAAISLIVGFSFYLLRIDSRFYCYGFGTDYWFIGSVFFLRNEVNKPNPFIWALAYYVLLVFTQSRF
jgi:prepilin signal peptidase PulO-like enzyme (type II secretory pathway)